MVEPKMGFEAEAQEALLDPLAWQAVGKTRLKEWGEVTFWRLTETEPTWRNKWHRFIDHLADGKTIDEALAAMNA